MLYLVGHDQEWCAPLPDLPLKAAGYFPPWPFTSSGNPKLCIEGWEESGSDEKRDLKQDNSIAVLVL